jgi:hypothetical protein
LLEVETLRQNMDYIGEPELTFRYIAYIAAHPSLGPEEEDTNLPKVSFKIILTDQTTAAACQNNALNLGSNNANGSTPARGQDVLYTVPPASDTQTKLIIPAHVVDSSV